MSTLQELKWKCIDCDSFNSIDKFQCISCSKSVTYDLSKLSQLYIALELHSESMIEKQCRARTNQFIDDIQKDLDQYIITDISSICFDFYYIKGIPLSISDICEIMQNVLKRETTYSQICRAIDVFQSWHSKIHFVPKHVQIKPAPLYEVILSIINHIDRGHIFKKLDENYLFDITIVAYLDFYTGFNEKCIGNDKFERQQYKPSIVHYENMADHLGMDHRNNVLHIDDERDDILSLKDRLKKLRLISFKNIANTYLRLNNWDECIAKCDPVLIADPNDGKALFRRGVAYRKKGMWLEAEHDLNKSIATFSANHHQIIQQEIDAVIAKDRKWSNQIYRVC